MHRASAPEPSGSLDWGLIGTALAALGGLVAGAVKFLSGRGGADKDGPQPDLKDDTERTLAGMVTLIENIQAQYVRVAEENKELWARLGVCQEKVEEHEIEIARLKGEIRALKRTIAERRPTDEQ